MPESCFFQQQIRRTKSEIQKKSEARNLKSETPAKEHRSTWCNATVQRLIAPSDFVLLSDFDIRISDLRRTPTYNSDNHFIVLSSSGEAC